MKVEQNIKRLKYLLSLFSMTIDDLLILISEGLKNPILEEEILSDNIKLSHLKRIDKVFLFCLLKLSMVFEYPY